MYMLYVRLVQNNHVKVCKQMEKQARVRKGTPASHTYREVIFIKATY